eukprot:12413583-Karenia_brevis.AAC.1
MDDMLDVAGLHMHQEHHQVRVTEQPKGPEGLGATDSSSRPREWGIRLSDQEWFPGPGGLASLGELLQLA